MVAYGRQVSGAMENRAAVFTSQPQAVEVYQAGTWWAGELLGWRHDANDSCQVWVRVVLGGVEETAWTELASLRLPERHLAVAGEPTVRGGAYGPDTQEMSIARHPSGRRARTAAGPGSSATAGLPGTRDLTVVPVHPADGGRRTAADTAQFASVGRRRAPEGAASPLVGGRRTAEETAQFASVGRRRAPETSSPRPLPAVPAGRHRAADTTVLAAVSDPAASTARVATSPVPGGPSVVRPAVPVQGPTAGTGDSWTAPEGLGAELITRPMRLSDHVPHARRPRVDGSVGA